MLPPPLEPKDGLPLDAVLSLTTQRNGNWCTFKCSREWKSHWKENLDPKELID